MLGTSVFFVINPDLKDLAINRGAESFAVALVMFMGIANALGRLCVPLLSDKTGRNFACIMIVATTALGAFCLCFVEGFWLIATIIAVAFCFGGFAGLYPVLTSDNFGVKNIGSNYGAVMVGFMISALVFPVTLSKIEDQYLKFVILGILAVIGAVLIITLSLRKNKQ